DVIDAGVFHNDVISVANENVLVCHAKAFVSQPAVLNTLKTQQPSVEVFQVSSDELSVADAVSSYIFNSQLVTLPNGTMLFLAPEECRTNPSARSVLDRLKDEVDVVSEVEFVDVRQSMQNGGGPACLRLRVVLTEDEVAAIHQPILLTDATYQKLTFWVQQHYREELTLEDLADPELYREGCAALDELTQILELGAIYPFQK
ncbi:N-succinylarginine dihydrolase, partial [Thalassoglobus sp.]|uniref:N-succinylarginine dihydrolase n=1 Tax=Thalassoglobus sp. TaxID=2795869 RepID=UPI003AA81A1C